jgi:hypothetical protein
MKFHHLRPALVLASSLVLASCGGGGGSETYPIKVTVKNVQYKGLVLSTNGQRLEIPVPAKAGDPVVLTFANGLDYGTYYNVIPEGGTAAGGGAQPEHQSCASDGYPREYGTAGQTASLESARKPAIEVFYTCHILSYELSGTISGATTGTITLINGSNSQTVVDLSKGTTFRLGDVPYGTSYGVTVLTQPDGYTCTVDKGTGVMLDVQEKAGGVKDVTVTCVAKT